MKHLKLIFTIIACFAVSSVCNAKGEKVECGTYTVESIDKDVWHIMDCTKDYPAGMVSKDGKMVAYNNISDMYLINGGTKALLIDLSNKIAWGEDADKHLRKIISDRIGKRELIVTVTHAHGDHTGMAYAFTDDPSVKFVVPAVDFFKPNDPIFPADRPVYFNDGYRIDLGKRVALKSFVIPGHTPGSTLFFFEGRNMCFTGDGIGSGNGVWLFNYDALENYANAVDRLDSFLNNPSNGIDKSKLIFYGGHSHQKGNLASLGIQYFEDMKVLLEKMKTFTAEYEVVNFNRLNRNYHYGQAWITCNEYDAVHFYDTYRFPADKDVVGRGPTHYAKHAELIKKLDEHKTTIDSRVGEMKYYLYDPTKYGADPSKKYPMVIILHGANNGKNGVQCASDSDCYTFLSEEYQKLLGTPAYFLFPKANEGSPDNSEPVVGTWMTMDKETGRSIYIPSVVGIINEVIAENNVDASRLIVGGTSAGGFMTWQFLIDNYKMVKGAFLMAPAFCPTKEMLDNYEAAELPIWIIHGRKDAMCIYDKTTGPNEARFEKMPQVRLSVLEHVRYGDKGLVYFSPDRSDTMGQHLALFAVGQNLIYDDGTPYDPRYPDGMTGWMKMIFSK